MKIETPADLALWKLEAKEIGTLLERIEAAERTILTSLGCPTDLATLYDILSGKPSAPAPWPARTAARDQQRARFAMHALYHARAARRHFGPNPAKENPRRAAYHALLAGAYAGDVVIAAENAALGARARKGKTGASLVAAKVRTTAARDRDARIRAEADPYRRRHPYSREYSTRALAAYVALKLRGKASTIRARLSTLKIR